MLKHYYISPKKRTKSQSSETSDNSDGTRASPNTAINWHQTSPLCLHDYEHLTIKPSATSIASWLTSKANQQLHTNFWCNTNCSSSFPLETGKISKRRPPSGITSLMTNVLAGETNMSCDGGNTSASVRRWNSFHSTRGECHPNKFRRERKSTSPSLEFERKRYLANSANVAQSRSRELRRGKSLATPCGGSSSSLISGTQFTDRYGNSGSVHCSDDALLLKSGIATSLW